MKRAEFIEKWKPDGYPEIAELFLEDFESDLDALLKDIAKYAYAAGVTDGQFGDIEMLNFEDYWNQLNH